LVIPAAKDIGIDKYKIVKDKDKPDCGTYDGMDSFKNTQKYKRESNVFMSKLDKKSFVDDVVKKKRNSLGPGHYDIKNLNSAFNRLSSSPTRSKRH